MAEADNPRPGVSLTRKQLDTELGAELLSLCQGVTADGTLTGEEVNDLRAWLMEHPSDDLPAIAHLRGVLNQVLADGRITPNEVVAIHKALESVLPVELRNSAREARRGQAKAERERNRPIGSANFMVAGVRHEGRPAIISRHVNAGETAVLQRDRDNVHSPHAIAVYTASWHQVGFMPEDDARDWAGDLDSGAKVIAVFTTVLTGGRSPIPVVDAIFYPRDADVWVAAVSPVAHAPKAVGRSIPRWAWWMLAIIAIAWWLTANGLGETPP